MNFNNNEIQYALKEKYPNNKIDLKIIYEPLTMDMEMTIKVDSVPLNKNISLSTVEDLSPRLNESVRQVLLKFICTRVDEYLESKIGKI